MKTAINPTRAENFPEWYQQVIAAADMAENSDVRGCMIIKPHGYGIWELIQRELDNRIKDEGVQNAYFPLLIPLSYMSKEAEHVEGFAKECAVVTHHRLEEDKENGGLKPAGELTEPYIIRPTSETIIGEAFSKWINSYRDLPYKINQWANVFRWEMRTRLFIRTAEFLWQEGHNVFPTADNANQDARRMLDVYYDLMTNVLAMPGICGEKTADERFPGAIHTYTVESMMQDGKSLQACTSHDLGQTFSKSANIQYQDEQGEMQLAHTTSWGMSTRIIGGLIMTHSDDDGLRLPPKVAPQQVVIIPMIKKDADPKVVMDACHDLASKLKAKNIRVFVDEKDTKTSDKIWGWVKKGAPVRVTIGGREAENSQVEYALRTDNQKQITTPDDFVANIDGYLTAIHNTLFEQAEANLNENVHDAETIFDLINFFRKKTNMGFVRMPVALLDDPKFEETCKEFALTPRCLPFADNGDMVIVGKSY